MEKPKLKELKEQIELEEGVGEIEKRVATQEVLVQEQPNKDKNNELLVLLITIDSLVSKAIKIIKTNIND